MMRAGALRDELPYLTCCSVDGFAPVHVLSDDTLGFAIEIDNPVVDTVVDGEVECARTIATMLHALQGEMQWQWFYRIRPHVGPLLRSYESGGVGGGTAAEFADSLLTRWRIAQQQGFFPGAEHDGLYPRQESIVLALKSAPIGMTTSGWRALLDCPIVQRHILRRRPSAGAARPRLSAQQAAERFVAVARDLLAALHASGWSGRPLGGEELASWVIDTVFPQRTFLAELAPQDARRRAAPAGGEDVRDAIAAVGRIDAIGPAGFRSVCRGKVCYHRAVSMTWTPRFVEAGLLRDLTWLRPNLSVVVCAAPVSTTASLVHLKSRAFLNERSTHSFNQSEMDARREALDEVERRLFAEGERIFLTSVHVHLCEADAATAARTAAFVRKHFESKEIEACVEADIGATVLLRSCLPFGATPQSDRAMRRRRRLLTRDCADLHPVGGGWTGNTPPASPAASRRQAITLYATPLGQPLTIDPTCADKNPHALVIGQSGSGKSFFVHDYLLHLWRLPDVRIFLISIKPDYRKIALVLGKYVEVRLDGSVSLNPFAGPPTLENQARWSALLDLMLADGSGTGPARREVQVALQEAALTAAQHNWDASCASPLRETLLEDICLELERHHGILGRQLALGLQPYRHGPYRKLFNAPRGIHADDRFVFYNLGNILGQPCAPAVSFSVFGLIDEVMQDPRWRAVPKGLVADEVWALIRNPEAADILERSLKSYRSLGGFAMPIVQDPRDLDTPGGRAMLFNTATKIVLPLDRAGQVDVDKYLRLNDRERSIIGSLRLAKRRYSEFFASFDGVKSAKGLLIPDPLRYAIATTDPVDEARIEAMYQRCGNLMQAVRDFARQFPYGVEMP